MLKMRLQRVGRKHEPAFRLVLTDSKNSTKSGRFLEILGSYDPRKATDLIKADRVKHWLSKGVGVTDSVYNLLVTHKVIDGKKKNVLPQKTPIIKDTPAEPVEAPESRVEEVPSATEAAEPESVPEAPAEAESSDSQAEPTQSEGENA